MARSENSGKEISASTGAQAGICGPGGEDGPLRFLVGQLSDRGLRRATNEDSLLALQLSLMSEGGSNAQMHLFAIADGIGGGSTGEKASHAAVRALAEAFTRTALLPSLSDMPGMAHDPAARLREMVQYANRAVLALREERGGSAGATMTALLLCGSGGVVANVGDSRTCCYRGARLTQITRDHTIVADLVASGLISEDDACCHEQRGVILRSLGERPALEVDVFPVQAHPGDRFLLCCDGLWEMVPAPQIERVLRDEPHPQSACRRLVELANRAGGVDNISVIVVDALPG
jgi:protein phosphatase